MTPAQQATYHRQYDRWLIQQERIAVRLVLVQFRFIFSHLQYGLTQGNAQSVLALLDLYVTASSHQRMLEGIYTRVGVAAAQNQYNRLIPPKKADPIALLTKDRDAPELPRKPRPNSTIRIDHNSEMWRQRMIQMARSSETALRIQQVTAKTRQLVRDMLTRSAEQGWTLPKLVKKLRTVVVDRTRATLIARTETTRAASAGHEAGAASTLLTLNKIWIATSDARTRDAHRAMIGSKPVPSNGMFLVGGMGMKYPGDPAGGAANCCRCRCTVSYVPANTVFD